MTLVEYAAIAEIVASAAVIASLIYVARQLRQNTEVVLGESANSLVQHTLHMAGDVANDREVAECWVKAGNDFEALDEIDQQRAVMFEFRAIQGWAHWYRLRQRGLFPDEQWNELVWFIANLGAQRQAVREAWKVFRPSYPKELQAFLGQYLD